MAYLFTIDNNVAKPTTETLLISPYKEIWERDISKDKSRAIREFTYIELYSSKKKTNPYSGYEDNQRDKELRKLLFSIEWEPDELIKEAIDKIEKFQQEASPSYTFYVAANIAANKLKDFFLTFDFNERDRTGKPIFKPKEISSAINDAEQNIRSLNNIKEKVEQELFEATKTRNNREVNHFEV